MVRGILYCHNMSSASSCSDSSLKKTHIGYLYAEIYLKNTKAASKDRVFLRNTIANGTPRNLGRRLKMSKVEYSKCILITNIESDLRQSTS
jgi:hypothetical protein